MLKDLISNPLGERIDECIDECIDEALKVGRDLIVKEIMRAADVEADWVNHFNAEDLSLLI